MAEDTIGINIDPFELPIADIKSWDVWVTSSGLVGTVGVTSGLIDTVGVTSGPIGTVGVCANRVGLC